LRYIHKTPRGEIFAISHSEQCLAGFPQFHSAHHNNKLYRFELQKILVAMTVVVKIRASALHSGRKFES
jgi:hypothetical protein